MLLQNYQDELPNNFFHFIACPVCNNENFKLILKIRYGNLKQKQSLDYSAISITKDTMLFVRQCIKCGFVFVNPRIKPEYQHVIYNECKKKMYELKPQLISVGTKQHGVSARKAKLEHIKPLLEVLSHVNLGDENLTMFDYGCGFGYSMSLARELGLNVFGVDIDRERLSVCEALGLKVADPAEFDSRYPDVKADIILCQSNIEHVVDLPATMDYLKGKSKMNTILYVNSLTPRIISIERKRGEFDKAHFIEHINFFPVRTLDYFMDRYGFRPLPTTRVSFIKTFKDTFREIGAYLLLNTLGNNPLSGHFTRIYQYNPER